MILQNAFNHLFDCKEKSTFTILAPRDKNVFIKLIKVNNNKGTIMKERRSNNSNGRLR